MLTEAVIFFAIAAGFNTVFVTMLGLRRARLWLSLPASLVALAGSITVTSLIDHDPQGGLYLATSTFVVAVLLHIWQPRWSLTAAQLLAAATLACFAYLAFAGYLTVWLLLNYNVLWFLSSLLLLGLEIGALLMALTYGFEMLDVLSRQPRPGPRPPLDQFPMVAVQVPTYNEPLEVVQPTLESLALLDYPNYMVQVVDNNTPDPSAWEPLRDLCERLGPRFQFIHLDDWPGFKAGALNEATRRLPPEVDILAVVDADYIVNPSFLSATIPHFGDPTVAFVQTPQNYRDWKDDRYLRGLFFSYRYFFDITMASRANRNAIIFCGTMGLLRRAALEAIGGWSETCITEDAEASLRILGHGYRGVFDPEAQGSGLMPLDFEGLKKQRYRWALGGVQILRMHWRELVPGLGGSLKLTAGQRAHYLLGSLQWFGDVLAAAFTMLLALTAVGIAVNHRLPVRQLTGPLVIVPVIFLATGLLRASWAIKTIERCGWRDAVRSLRIWFALSWVVTLACITGLIRRRAVFLRTPKRREGASGFLTALAASRSETTLGFLAMGSTAAMLWTAHSPPFVLLGGMLLFEATVYFSAVWAALAAEGIQLTPLREAYRRSSQNTGDRPAAGGHILTAVPLGAVVVLAAAVAAGLLAAAPGTGGPQPPGLLGPGNRIGPAVNGGSPSAPAGSPSAAPGVGPSPSPVPQEPLPSASGSSGTTTTPGPVATPVPASTPRSNPAPSP